VAIDQPNKKLLESGDTELVFLCSPAVREGAGKAADGEIGRCASVSDGFDHARRHEGERGEVSDVTLALVLASGYLLELQSGAIDVAITRETKSLVHRHKSPAMADNAR
jgi:hypothetical protein